MIPADFFSQVLENSGRIHEFSRHFASRLHQNQRSEISLETLPSLAEVEDMIRGAQCLHAGLDRIRSSVMYQQAALADERQRAFQNKLYQEDVNGYSDDMKGNFAAGDAKKRRGVCLPIFNTNEPHDTNANIRKLLLQDVVIAAIVPKHRNGDEVPTERVLCAMPVVYTMQS